MRRASPRLSFYRPTRDAGGCCGALTATKVVAQPLRYAARELDPTTGLYYVRARWYDPHQGRFVSEDPIGLEGGINLYSYAANSPTNMTDPSGLFPKWALVPVDANKDGKVDGYKCVNGGNPFKMDGITTSGEPRANSRAA